MNSMMVTRLLDQKRALDNWTMSIAALINAEAFDLMPEREQTILKRQRRVMNELSHVLSIRITRMKEG